MTPKTLLKPSKNHCSGPWPRLRGFSSKAAKAGLSDSELKVEIITDTPTVTANCWYMRPVMPGMNTVGINTAIKASDVPIIGPVTSFIVCKVASFGLKPRSI